MGKNNSESTKRIEPSVFFITIVVLIAICIPLLLFPEKGTAIVNSILATFTTSWGWVFSIFGFATLVFMIWVSFSRFGKIKLGPPGEKPTFSNIAWISMMFCGGMGCSLIYWSIMEPIYYLQGPPFGLEVGSYEAIQYAAAYGGFHWGIIPWAAMCIPAIPISYYYYVRKKSFLSFSACFEGQFNGRLGAKSCRAIDVLVMFGTIACCCTTLGLGTPMISACIQKITGIPDSFGLTLVIVLIWVCIFSCSCYLGLDKGLRRLSEINIYAVIALCGFILITGPTSFIMNSFTNSIGVQLNNFFMMSFYTDPYTNSGWPQAWTIFYWAWWICAAPYVAVFVAKISCGRTIKQVALGTIIWGTVGDLVGFCTFGGSAVYTELFGNVSMTDMLVEAGPATVIANIVGGLPVGNIILPIFIVIMLIFSATTFDSCAYVMATISTKGLKPNEEPARWNRVFWAFAIAFAAITLMWLGGLKPLQTVSIIVAFPILIITIFACWFLVRDMKADVQSYFNVQNKVLEIYYDENQTEPTTVAAVEVYKEPKKIKNHSESASTP